MTDYKRTSYETEIFYLEVHFHSNWQNILRMYSVLVIFIESAAGLFRCARQTDL